MTVKNDDETPMHGIMCPRGGKYRAFFDDMFRFIAYKHNTRRRRYFHFLPSGFTPFIGEALVKIACESPDYALQVRVRQAVADWGWMQDGMEQCCRIGAHILDPYQSLLADSNPKNFLRFFAKIYEAWKTLTNIGKQHLTWQVQTYALRLMDYVILHPSEFRLDSSAREILGLM